MKFCFVFAKIFDYKVKKSRVHLVNHYSMWTTTMWTHIFPETKNFTKPFLPVYGMFYQKEKRVEHLVLLSLLNNDSSESVKQLLNVFMYYMFRSGREHLCSLLPPHNPGQQDIQRNQLCHLSPHTKVPYVILIRSSST